LRAEALGPLVLGPLTGGDELFACLPAEIAREAGGNPGYLNALRDERTGPVVERHLSALSESARELVRTAALLEPDCPAEEIAAATRQAECIAEAVRAGVLAETRGRFRFKYPIVRRVLRDGIPPAIRVTLHRRIAQRIAAAGAPPERVAAQLVAVPLDDWTCEWLTTHLPSLADRAPRAALDLLSHLNSQTSVPATLAESVAAAVGRLLGSAA
jgi:hypothetical protein